MTNEERYAKFKTELFYKTYYDNLEEKCEKYRRYKEAREEKNSEVAAQEVEEESFSSNIEKYSEDVKMFIEYVKICTFQDENTFLFLERRKNQIAYGKMQKGTRTDIHTIDMISAADLQAIYEQLKIEFASSLTKKVRRTLALGWSLLPMIGENVIIDINSDNSTDRKMFRLEKKSNVVVGNDSAEVEKVNIKK